MQSLAHQFLTFARSKPADEVYRYCDPDSCAWAQFFDFLGLSREDRLRFEYGRDKSRWHTCQARNPLVSLAYGGPGAQSFGALATRLEAALTEQVPA